MNAGSASVLPRDDLEVLDAVEDEVHPRDGRGDVDELLPVEPSVRVSPPRRFTSASAEMSMPPVPTGRVVDALARLRLEHLRHQVHERAVGVELLRGVAAVVGELLDQVLVAVAELVLGHVREAERVLREVLDEVLERLVGHLRLVGPRRVAEDAGEALRVGRLDRAEGVESARPTSREAVRTSSQCAPSGIAKRSSRGGARVAVVAGVARAPLRTPRPTRPTGA